MKINVMCKGSSEDQSIVCGDRDRCKRFKADPDHGQAYREFYKAGDNCQHYVGLGGEWNESRMDDIGRNGNVGYEL